MGINDHAYKVTFTDKSAYRKLPKESMLLVCENVPKDYMPLYGELGDNIDGPVTQRVTTVELAKKQDNLAQGRGIILDDNTVEVDTEVIADVDYVDASINDTMNFIIQERDAEHAGRVAGDDLINGKIGDLADLETEAKDNLVAAINEAAAGGKAEWGYIEGTLTDQEDLAEALNEKQHVLTAGANITIVDNVISANGGGAGVEVVQTTGQSTTAVMSQKAVTDLVGNIENLLRTL